MTEHVLLPPSPLSPLFPSVFPSFPYLPSSCLLSVLTFSSFFSFLPFSFHWPKTVNSGKTGLFNNNNKNLHFPTCDLLPTTGKSGQQRTFVYRGDGIGRGFYKWRAHWQKLGVSSVVASHWPSCDGLSLAGLLLREGKSFFPLAG